MSYEERSKRREKLRRKRKIIHVTFLSALSVLLLGLFVYAFSANNSNVNNRFANQTEKREKIKSNKDKNKKEDKSSTGKEEKDKKSNKKEKAKDDDVVEFNTLPIQKGTNHRKESNKFAMDTALIKDYMTKNKEYTGEKIAFLTFDDGPSENTISVLNTLKDKDVKATFFVVGGNILHGDQETFRRIYDEGHAVAMHSLTHDYSLLYPGGVCSYDRVKYELNETIKNLNTIYGDEFKSKVWRYPGGHMSWKEIEKGDAALAEKDVEWIDWNALNGDGEADGPTDEQSMLDYFKYTMERKDVAVILMHDSWPKVLTANTLPKIIDYLKDEGYSFKILE